MLFSFALPVFSFRVFIFFKKKWHVALEGFNLQEGLNMQQLKERSCVSVSRSRMFKQPAPGQIKNNEGWCFDILPQTMNLYGPKCN